MRLISFYCIRLFLLAVAILILGFTPRPGLANDHSAHNESVTKIDHIMAFILNYGVNNVTFWGVDDYAPNVVMHQSAKIIRANSGHPGNGNFDVYFAMSGNFAPIFAVAFSDDGGFLRTSLSDAGQSNAYGVRYFNGIWDGHCQTFAVSNLRKIDEQTGATWSNLSLYYFEPGLDDKSGESEGSPVFSLLKTFRSTNANPDPDIVISQEFSIPLPHKYYTMTSDVYPHAGKYAAELSKELSLPIENYDNSYYPSKPDKGC